MPNLPTIEYDFIGVGWIPNLSGQVTDSEYLRRKVSLYNSHHSEDEHLQFIEGTTNYVLSPLIGLEDWKHHSLKIVFDDDCGRCSIYCPRSLKDCFDSRDFLIVTGFNQSWLHLRQAVDSSSRLDPPDTNECVISRFVRNHWPRETEMTDVIYHCVTACSCTAMDKIIPSANNDKETFCKLITKRFIDVGEDISDSLRYLTNEDLIREIAVLEYNHLYAKSFINLYPSTDIGGMRDIMELRYSKARVVSDYHVREISEKNTRIYKATLAVSVFAFLISVVSLASTLL